MNMKMTQKELPDKGDFFMVVRRHYLVYGEKRELDGFTFHVRYDNGDEKKLCFVSPDTSLEAAFAMAVRAMERK